MDQTCGICSLPEEMLVKILEYAFTCFSVEGEEYISIMTLLNLQNTWGRFAEVIQSKSNIWCRTVRLTWRDLLTPECLRVAETFILGHKESIKVLDLTDCYCLGDSDITSVSKLVQPLENLCELHVAGIRLPWTCIFGILRSKNLDKLSFTWDNGLDEVNSKYQGTLSGPRESLDKCPPLKDIQTYLRNLKSLVIHLGFPQVSHRPVNNSQSTLVSFISSFVNLEDLGLLSWEPFWDTEGFNSNFADIPGIPELTNFSGESGLPPTEAYRRFLNLPNLRSLTVKMTESPVGPRPVLIKCLISEALRDTQNCLGTLYIDYPEVEVEVGRNDHMKLEGLLPEQRVRRVRVTADQLIRLQATSFSTIPDDSLCSGRFRQLERFYWKAGFGQGHLRIEGMLGSSPRLKFLSIRSHRLELNWMNLVDCHLNLRELCIPVRPPNGNVLREQYEHLSRLVNLKKISLPLCCLSELEELGQEGNETCLGLFCGSSASKDKLEELEIGFDFSTKSSVPSSGPINASGLERIELLSNLRSLTLTELNLELSESQFIRKISESCVKLEALKLLSVVDWRSETSIYRFLGDLISSLKNFKYLEDFRLDQRGLHSVNEVLEGLFECGELLIVSISGDKSSSTCPEESQETKDLGRVVYSLFSKCRRLKMLHVVTPTATTSSCTHIKQSIQTNFSQSRLGLNVTILNGAESPRDMRLVNASCPSIHYRSMVRNDSQVSQIHFHTLP